MRNRDLVWSLRGGLRDEAVERRSGTLDFLALGLRRSRLRDEAVCGFAGFVVFLL